MTKKEEFFDIFVIYLAIFGILHIIAVSNNSLIDTLSIDDSHLVEKAERVRRIMDIQEEFPFEEEDMFRETYDIEN